MSNGYGPIEKDKSNGQALEGDGATLTLNGATFAKGVGAHANSDVRYALNGGCERFLASVGVDDEVATNGSVVFQVYADATKVYDSGLMTGIDGDQADRRLHRRSGRAAPGGHGRRQRAKLRPRRLGARAHRVRERHHAPRRSPAGRLRRVQPGSPSASLRLPPSRRRWIRRTLTHEHLHAHQAGAADSGPRARLLSEPGGDARPDARAWRRARPTRRRSRAAPEGRRTSPGTRSRPMSAGASPRRQERTHPRPR